MSRGLSALPAKSTSAWKDGKVDTSAAPDVAAILLAHKSRLDVQFVIEARKPASAQALWRRYGEQHAATLRDTATKLRQIPKSLANKAVRRRRAVIQHIQRAQRSGVIGVRSVVSGGLPGLGRRR